MANWNAGYMSDVNYTYGYYMELNPMQTRVAMLNAGFSPPNIGLACELGFGQGVSINLHAAASGVRWFGTDFMPSQTQFARELASSSDAGLVLCDEAFADFCSKPDLPDFDYISLHGVWTWISDENRKVIVDFIARKLKVGGVLYISYNTLPGWAPMWPMRDLLHKYANVMQPPGVNIVERLGYAMEFAGAIVDAKANFTQNNPLVKMWLEHISGQDKVYLTHEYMNQHWQPMLFADLMESLSSAKLTYACSACYLDHVYELNLSGEQLAILREIPDIALRETTSDFFVNQSFRRDYWVKGGRRLTAIERVEYLRKEKVVLLVPAEDVPFTVKGHRGEVTLSSDVYRPLLMSLADYKPRKLVDIEHVLAQHGFSFDQMLQAVLVLMGVGCLACVQDDAVIAKARKNSEKINNYLVGQARVVDGVNSLASPVVGGGVVVDRVTQLFILARRLGKKTTVELATFVWGIISSEGQRIIKNGKEYVTEEESMAELVSQAEKFLGKKVAFLKSLEVI